MNKTSSCIHCGAPYTLRPTNYRYPENAPLFAWRYCDKCIAERPNNNPPFVEVRGK